MKPRLSSVMAAWALLWPAASGAPQDQGTQPSTFINKGCYSTPGSLKSVGYYLFQTSGYCQRQCVPQNKAVMALTKGTDCWCGDKLPPKSTLVDNKFCNVPCKGYNQYTCGGDHYYQVYLTGTDDSVGADDKDTAPQSAKATGTSSAQPSVVTVGGQTRTVFAETNSAAPNAKKSNGAGIAAGVVSAVVAITGISGGIFLFLRRRRQRAVEEEYRRNAAMSEFMGKGKDSASSVSDSRLDPSVMMQRRQSDGSIADNQDYSRRILKVTNPSD